MVGRLKLPTEWRWVSAEWAGIGWLRPAGLLALALSCPCAWSATNSMARFHETVEPILKEYCYDCHGDGMNKGNVAFDEFRSDDEFLPRGDLWLAVLNNVRAGMMPPG